MKQTLNQLLSIILLLLPTFVLSQQNCLEANLPKYNIWLQKRDHLVPMKAFLLNGNVLTKRLFSSKELTEKFMNENILGIHDLREMYRISSPFQKKALIQYLNNSSLAKEECCCVASLWCYQISDNEDFLKLGQQQAISLQDSIHLARFLYGRDEFDQFMSTLVSKVSGFEFIDLIGFHEGALSQRLVNLPTQDINEFYARNSYFKGIEPDWNGSYLTNHEFNKYLSLWLKSDKTNTLFKEDLDNLGLGISFNKVLLSKVNTGALASLAKTIAKQTAPVHYTKTWQQLEYLYKTTQSETIHNILTNVKCKYPIEFATMNCQCDTLEKLHAINHLYRRACKNVLLTKDTIRINSDCFISHISTKDSIPYPKEFQSLYIHTPEGISYLYSLTLKDSFTFEFAQTDTSYLLVIQNFEKESKNQDKNFDEIYGGWFSTAMLYEVLITDTSSLCGFETRSREIDKVLFHYPINFEKHYRKLACYRENLGIDLNNGELILKEGQCKETKRNIIIPSGTFSECCSIKKLGDGSMSQ